MKSRQEALHRKLSALIQIRVLIVVKISQILLRNIAVERRAEHALPVNTRFVTQTVVRKQLYRGFEQRNRQLLFSVVVVLRHRHDQPVQSLVIMRERKISLRKRHDSFILFLSLGCGVLIVDKQRDGISENLMPQITRVLDVIVERRRLDVQSPRQLVHRNPGLSAFFNIGNRFLDNFFLC